MGIVAAWSWRRTMVLAVWGVLMAGLTSCITPSEKRGIKEDMFNVQTRLLNLERLLADTSKDAKSTGESATRRIASTQSELERLSREMQQVHGDIDALRVGVTTGQMPGVDPATQERSVAALVGKLSERLDAIEAAQQELLEAIKKAGIKSAKKKESKPLTDLAGLQKAFEDKAYKQVIDEAPRFIKAGSADDREHALFLQAESLFRVGNIREAALKFNDFIEGKPSPRHLSEVKLRLGDCFRHLGDSGTAKVYYDEVVKEYPGSQDAAKASERLADILANKKPT